ncbi:MAG: TonB-dependent receptor [Bacteroidales bacterium]|nr:TonB-dependent receptor [Bacteroidales bacterium]
MNLIFLVALKTLIAGIFISVLLYSLISDNKQNKVVPLLLFLLCIPSITTLAQSKGSINGTIIDSDTKSPIGYSSIALYTVGDSNLVSGVISNENGDFLLADVPQGDYYIDISYMGYQKTSKNNIKISNESSSYNVGTVELAKEVKQLEEVEIKGEMLKAKEEVDRTVYVVNSDMAAAAHSGLEILRQVPTVAVDFQNNISINGSSNILIFVDGKQRDGDYLAQLNPASIEKIEVMDNPSAKYNADVSAVLFVITKKEARLGITGRFEAEAPVSPQKISNNSANLEWGYSNIRVFASWHMHYESFEDVGINSERVSDIDNIHTILEQNGLGTGTFANQKFHYGMDYFINDKNSLSFYGNYRPPSLDQEMKGRTTSSLIEDGSIINYFVAENSEDNNNVSSYYSVFYKHSFNKTAHELTADINYYNYDGTNKSFYNTQYYMPDMITPFDDLIFRDETTDNQRSRLRFKTDYSHPVNEYLKIEIGYEGEIQWYDNKFYVTNDELADQLEYDEFRNAGYVSLAGKWNKLSYQGGLRYEDANILINNDTTADYYCVLPQFNINYKFNKENSIKFSYRKSIDRPGIGDLNPFVRYSDSLHLSRGNPELDPRYKHKLELSYTRNIGSNFVTPSVYMYYFDNMFNSIVTINENNVSESYVDNVGEGFEYGMSVRGGFQVFKFWRLNPDITGFYKELHAVNDAGIYDIPDQDMYSWRGGLTSLMFFPKDFMLIFYGYYASPNIDPQRTNSRSPVYILAVQKSFMKQAAQVSAFTYLPFTKEFTAEKTVYEGRDFTQTSEFTIPPRTLFTIRLSYKFNYGNKVKKIERDKNTDEDNGGGLF